MNPNLANQTWWTRTQRFRCRFMPEGEPHLGCMFRFWLEGVKPGPNHTNSQSTCSCINIEVMSQRTMQTIFATSQPRRHKRNTTSDGWKQVYASRPCSAHSNILSEFRTSSRWISCTSRSWMILIFCWAYGEAQSRNTNLMISRHGTGQYSRIRGSGRLMVILLLLPSHLFHHPLVMLHGIQPRRSTWGTKHGSTRYIYMDSALPCSDMSFHDSIGSTIANLLQGSGFFNNVPSCQNSSVKQTRIYVTLLNNLRTSITNERNIVSILFAIASTFSHTLPPKQFVLGPLHAMSSGHGNCDQQPWEQDSAGSRSLCKPCPMCCSLGTTQLPQGSCS